MHDAMNSVAIHAHSVRASIDNTLVLKGVTAAFARGQWTSVVGPNGAGKSTLLKVLAGLLPFEGSVDLLGQALSSWQRKQRAQNLSWLGQHETAVNDLRVYDVAMLGRLPHQAWLAAPNAQDHAVVEQCLRATQAWAWRARALGALSAGERQRVLLARALAVQAQVLLMDEPLTNLDPPHQADWLAIVRALRAQGKTVISVLHEVSMALQADQILIMADGAVTHQGPSSDPRTHQALQAVFDERIRVLNVQGQYLAVPLATP
jgi:iron complex transport system ATP-binding protein